MYSQRRLGGEYSLPDLPDLLPLGMETCQRNCFQRLLHFVRTHTMYSFLILSILVTRHFNLILMICFRSNYHFCSFFLHSLKIAPKQLTFSRFICMQRTRADSLELCLNRRGQEERLYVEPSM